MISLNNCLKTIYEINALKKKIFVNYEQSLFTSYFKEFLGGNAKTIIIGNISPF